MPNRKSCLTALLALGLVLFVAGCGGGKEAETVPTPPEPAVEPEVEVQEEAPVEVKEETWEEQPVAQ